MKSQKLQSGEQYYFLTFTIPNPDLALLETRAIVNYAWRLFRESSLCVSLIRGGVKSEEFTLTQIGFHYHLHCIVRSKWLPYQEIRRTWTDCVKASFRYFERPFGVNTKDGMLLVNIKPIASTYRAVMEVCKYITKSDSWFKMRRRDLIQVALIRRWHRMFEMFGSFRSPKATKAAVNKTILDKERIIPDQLSHDHRHWRDRARQIGSEMYLILLELALERAYELGYARLRKQFPTNSIQILFAV